MEGPEKKSARSPPNYLAPILQTMYSTRLNNSRGVDTQQKYTRSIDAQSQKAQRSAPPECTPKKVIDNASSFVAFSLPSLLLRHSPNRRFQTLLQPYLRCAADPCTALQAPRHLRPDLRPAQGSFFFILAALPPAALHHACTPSHHRSQNRRSSAFQTLNGQDPFAPVPNERCEKCGRKPAHLPPDRRCVKLLRILSPQAELSSTSKTSAALTALFCRLRFPAELGAANCSSPSSGLGGRLSAVANCHSPSGGGEKGDIWGDVRVGESGVALVGEPSGVVCIELARLLSVMSAGGDGARASLPEARQPVVSMFVRTGDNIGLPVAECCPRRTSAISSSSIKISGTVNCGTAVMRPCSFCCCVRRNFRDQYRVSKNPITTFLRTASSTRCRRARRRRNSSSLGYLLAKCTLAGVAIITSSSCCR